jgi:hypothetical protein
MGPMGMDPAGRRVLHVWLGHTSLTKGGPCVLCVSLGSFRRLSMRASVIFVPLEPMGMDPGHRALRVWLEPTSQIREIRPVAYVS